MVALAHRESISYRHELGEQPGGRVPQLVLDLDVLSAARVSPFHSRFASTMAACSQPERTAYRELSLDVLLSQHSSPGRGRGPVFSGDAFSRSQTGKEVARARLEDSSTRRQHPS